MENLVVEDNFAGTFEGGVARFKLYGCALDVTTIRQEINNITANILTENSEDIETEGGEDLIYGD
jgi:hypothetical protein